MERKQADSMHNALTKTVLPKLPNMLFKPQEYQKTVAEQQA